MADVLTTEELERRARGMQSGGTPQTGPSTQPPKPVMDDKDFQAYASGVSAPPEKIGEEPKRLSISGGPLRSYESQVLDRFLPERPDQEPGKAAAIKTAGDFVEAVRDIPQTLVRGISEHPIETAAGAVPLLTGPGAPAAALGIRLAPRALSATAAGLGALADKFIPPLANNPSKQPTFSTGDALDVGMSSTFGYAFPNPTVDTSPAATARPPVVPRRPGSGYEEAVKEGAKEAGVYVTPGQAGNKGGREVEKVFGANPLVANMNASLVDKQKDAAEATTDALFRGVQDRAATGRTVKDILNGAQTKLSEENKQIFQEVSGSALRNAQNTVEANSIVANTLGNISKAYNLSDARLARPRSLEISGDTVSALKEAKAILDSNAAFFDYETVNGFRIRLGQDIADAQKAGRDVDVNVLTDLRDGLTEAQSKFLSPEMANRWEAYKQAYADYKQARNLLRPILSDQTQDSNVIKSIVSDVARLDAVMRYAEATGDQAVLQQIRGSFLQEVVEGSSTLKQFDAKMKAIGPVQSKYFNDETTSRARNLVALNQAIASLDSMNEQATRSVITNLVGVSGGLAGGAAAGGVGGSIGGLAAYLALGVVGQPTYNALVMLARQSKDRGVNEAVQNILRSGLRAEGAHQGSLTIQNMPLYPSEAR